MVGNIALDHLPSTLGQKMFNRYWFAQGDYKLTEKEFQYLTQIAEFNEDKHAGINVVSFYNTPEARTFGRATFYLDQNLKIVGFYDFYDFDIKVKSYIPFTKGGRSLKNEVITDITKVNGDTFDAKNFNVCYGIGCRKK